MAGYTTPAELAKQLGMRDATDARLGDVCDDVADRIDRYNGRTARLPDPAPATIRRISLSACVAVFKDPDAAFGVIGLNETGAVRVIRDPLDPHRDALEAYNAPAAWGIA